jgi:two-component system chemotaxis sensor kinase CheA
VDELERFKATYIEECKELLTDMEEHLLSLNGEHAEQEELNAIFRCAHSIKGGAGAFGFTRISKFTHVLETLLDDMRNGKISLSQEVIDILLESNDILINLISMAESNTEPDREFGSDIEKELIKIANRSSDKKPISHNQDENSSVVHIDSESAQSDRKKFYNIKFSPHKDLLSTGNEPILIIRELRSIGTLDVKTSTKAMPKLHEMNPIECYLNFDMDLESREPLSRVKEVFEFVEDNCDLSISEDAGLFSDTIATDIKESEFVNDNTTPITAEKKQKDDTASNNNQSVNSIRVDVDKIDRLVNLVGELVITQVMINAQTKALPFEQFGSLVVGVEELAHHTRELQDAVMAVRMQPVKSIFSRMPRLVRDLAKKLNKTINLELKGESTEVDKTIIEQLSDPLTHLIRNSADHGIESAQERLEAGKPKEGTIILSAEHRSGKIVIGIEDDGKGIDRNKVLKKAIEKGIVSEEEADSLSESQIDYLIFAPGFSTAATISDVSGRGVGMDVVKKNIENIGGYVDVNNDPGNGLMISIYIPLTLAILDGMIVSVGQEHYIIPINNILETLRPSHNEVKTIADSSDVINIRGEFIPLLYLHRLFNIPNSETEPEKALIVIVETNNKKYGLIVDELLGQQQVVIKSLDANTKCVDGISGATILGDGRVALILDMIKLLGLSSKNLVNKNKKVA